MVDKELPFKSVKVTLSSEALTRLDYIVKQASFRSYSSGVEECIRAVYDLMQEIIADIGDPESGIRISANQEARAFERVTMRMARFTGRRLVTE